MNELTKRVITALVLLLAVWGWYFHLDGLAFNVTLGLLGLLVTAEMILMVKLPYPVAYLLAAAVAWSLFVLTLHVTPLLLMIFFWFLLFVAAARGQAAEFGAFTAMIWLFGWLALFALVIAKTHVTADGQALVIGICLAVWTSDIAAYFAGRSFGRRKLCPAISPGKSIEGAWGGLFFGLPVASGYWIYTETFSFAEGLLLAFVAVIAGMLGDLSESAVKRLVGVKDSGRWLPGHGGFLDRLDAILMAVPVTWLVWRTL